MTEVPGPGCETGCYCRIRDLTLKKGGYGSGQTSSFKNPSKIGLIITIFFKRFNITYILSFNLKKKF